MSAAPKLYAVPSGPEIAFEIEEAKPLVPDSEYKAICSGADVRIVFQTMKIFLRFRITEGEYEGVELFRAYRSRGRIIPGKGPGTGPRPRLHRDGDLFKMLCKLLGLPDNTKAQRVSYNEIKGKLCKIKTRTVTLDHKQKKRAPYSVVDDVLTIEAG